MESAAADHRVVQPGAVPRSALVRWALAGALVLGVLGMHALMGPPAAAADTGGTTVGDVMSMSVPGATGETTREEGTASLTGDTAPMGGHSPAGGHSMLTMCMAVLGALAAAVLLVAALVLRTARVAQPAGARFVGARPCLDRPPPWTVPSLHQLSLLQV